MTIQNLSRRTFIQASAAVGGGLLIGFHMPMAQAAKIESKPFTPVEQGTEINAWLAIKADGTVTIRVPHTEMGQGGLTSVALLIAEELDVPWDKIQTVFADANRHIRNNKEYKVMTTHGSQLVARQHPHLMQAGASARERLKEAAAKAWGVERSAVEAKQGVLKSGNRTGSYAEFAAAAAKIALDKEPEIKKDPKQWWLLGKEGIQRLDIPHKVNGTAAYAIDTRLPGMVYAAVKASPVPWGAVKSYNFDAIKSRPGVIAAVELKAVPGKRDQSDMQNGVAVVADTWYRAKTALELMPIEWDFGDSVKQSTQSLYDDGHKLFEQKGNVSKDDPKALEIIAASKKVVTADYERPFETHARMEPINATVWVQADRVDIWSPSQDQSAPILIVADQLKRDPKDIYTHTMFLGGGFGGNGGGGTAVTRQAAEISKQVGKPVKVVWTREEDIAQDKARPLHMARLTAALNDKGLPEAIMTRAVWAPIDGPDRWSGFLVGDYGIANMPYAIPNRHHERHSMKTHVPSSTHRAPGANQTGFMTESFVDEIAIAGGWNPLDWRIEMTKDRPDYQLVLKTLKEKSGFKTDLPKGEGMGVAVVESHGTIAAACATVTVSRRGQMTVEKVVIVLDCGHLINPRGGIEQSEGSVCWELSHAWTGGLEFKDGRFHNTNFDTYNLVRIDQMPQVETHFALSGGTKWGGLGEPAGPPTPPAVANAIWYASGKRIRSTPFRNHDLSWA
jgi:isoquinoline 1-oxidoreductase beta subunit